MSVISPVIEPAVDSVITPVIGGSSRLLTPLDIPTLDRWYSPAYDGGSTLTIVSGNQVSLITDINGNVDAAQSDMGLQPLYDPGLYNINGTAGIYYQNANVHLIMNSFFDLLGGAVFFVIDQENNKATYMADALTIPAFNIIKDTALVGIGSAAGGDPYWTPGPITLANFSTGVPVQIFFIGDSNLKGGVNGTLEDLGVGNDASGDTQLNYIARRRGSFNFTGIMTDVICLSAIPDQATIDKVVGYCAWQNGIEGSLPGGHPYENEPPMA